ncbi:MAG TPA: phosphotransferase family protein [Deltaproteobacteria bacterium]|nr:phosphotransferase family protein [Deltaproteobacteria bacterium]
MDVRDKPTRVRQGEELDLQIVESFLKDHIPGLTGKLVVEQFPSGYSNLTYLIKIGEKDIVLRRPPFGRKAKSAHDMGREYRILSALHPVFPYCPRPLIFSEDESVMGCPFFVMERINGIILRKDLPQGLVLSPSQMRALCERLVDVHYELHSVDYAAVGLEGFGKPEGYVKRQVEGWSDRYRGAWTPDSPTFEEVMTWLHGNMPPDCKRPSIVHNDFKFDNVVLNSDDPLKIIGVLDWEMATIGDPLMDLGNSLAYWVQADDPEEVQAMRMLATNLPGALTRDELIRRYADNAGISIDSFDFYYCFGLFRLAVIAQQIYYRFYHGQTKDQRFKMLVFAVHILEKSAREILEKPSL